MKNRFLSHYDHQRNRVEWLYSPYRENMISSHISLVYDGLEEKYGVYRGRCDLSDPSQQEEKLCMRRFNTLSRAVLWMIHNNLCHANATIHILHKQQHRFSSNLRKLASVYREVFPQRKPFQLDQGDFLNAPTPVRWLLAFNVLPYTEQELARAKELASQSTQTGSVVFKDLGHFEAQKKSLSQLDEEQLKGLLCRLMKPQMENILRPSVLKDLSGIDDIGLPTEEVRFSSQDDPLNAWKEEVCLVRSGALIEKNSWGERSVFEFNHSSWLPCAIARLLNGSPLSSTLKLSDVMSIFAGEGLHDERAIKKRAWQLLSDIWTFFRSPEALELEKQGHAHVFVFKLDGRVHFLVSHKNDVSHLDFDDIERGVVGLQGRHHGHIHFHFDPTHPFLGCLNHCASIQNFGKVEAFYYKNSEGLHCLVFDEAGHLSIDHIALSDQRVQLPRHAYSVAISIKNAIKDGPEIHRSPLVFNWLSKEKEDFQITDISQNIAKMVGAAAKRISPLKMVLRPESLQGFLAIYSMSNQIPIIDAQMEGHLDALSSKLGDIRNISKKYRIHLSQIQLNTKDSLMPTMADLPITSCDWLNLKNILEKAITASR